jgi:hypothetical protein
METIATTNFVILEMPNSLVGKDRPFIVCVESVVLELSLGGIQFTNKSIFHKIK